jgi:hypothetical protein
MPSYLRDAGAQICSECGKTSLSTGAHMPVAWLSGITMNAG